MARKGAITVKTVAAWTTCPATDYLIVAVSRSQARRAWPVHKLLRRAKVRSTARIPTRGLCSESWYLKRSEDPLQYFLRRLSCC